MLASPERQRSPWLWASAFVAIRSTGGHFAAGALALGRLLVTLSPWHSAAARRWWQATRAAWLGILGSGLLWFGLYMVTLNWGERDIDAGIAAILVNIGPILLALLGGWLLHEGFARRLAAGMAVSFGGVLVVGISESDGGRTSVISVVLCLVAAVCYAGGVVRLPFAGSCCPSSVRHTIRAGAIRGAPVHPGTGTSVLAE